MSWEETGHVTPDCSFSSSLIINFNLIPGCLSDEKQMVLTYVNYHFPELISLKFDTQRFLSLLLSDRSSCLVKREEERQALLERRSPNQRPVNHFTVASID